MHFRIFLLYRPVTLFQMTVQPWGIGQAVLAAKDLIHEPFAVINADDCYANRGVMCIKMERY